MKKIIALAAGVLVLSGCSASSDAATTNSEDYNTAYEGQLFEDSITLNDGRTVTCVILDIYKGGGLSCDWDNAITEEVTG